MESQRGNRPCRWRAIPTRVREFDRAIDKAGKAACPRGNRLRQLAPRTPHLRRVSWPIHAACSCGQISSRSNRPSPEPASPPFPQRQTVAGQLQSTGRGTLNAHVPTRFPIIQRWFHSVPELACFGIPRSHQSRGPEPRSNGDFPHPPSLNLCSLSRDHSVPPARWSALSNSGSIRSVMPWRFHEIPSQSAQYQLIRACSSAVRAGDS